MTDGIYLDEYEPVIHFYENPPDVAYYGTFIYKQVWDCKTSLEHMNKEEDPIHFYRIVSIVHGVRPVNTIFYFDGIEIILDTTSADQSRQDNADLWTASFKEVKYIDPTTKKVLRYDGGLSIGNGGQGVNPMNLFTPLDIFEEANFDKFLYEISDENLGPADEGNFPKTVVIDTKGDILRVGKETFTTLGKRKDKAECVLQLEDKGPVPHLYTDEYLPQCFIWNPKSRVYDSSYGGSLGKVSGNCFSVMNQELWKCTFQTEETTKEGTINTVEKTFHRRVTELVGAIPISKIEYFGAVSVWKYKLNSKSSSVRIKEIYYYQDNFHDQMRFNGTVKLIEPSKHEENEKQEDAFFYEYDSTAISVYPKIKGEMTKKPVQERIQMYSSGGGGGGGRGSSSNSGGVSSLFDLLQI